MNEGRRVGWGEMRRAGGGGGGGSFRLMALRRPPSPLFLYTSTHGVPPKKRGNGAATECFFIHKSELALLVILFMHAELRPVRFTSQGAQGTTNSP